ncbi:MAG TPA: DUF6690 family protein [Pirellulaceae bacterium]|nr:DUF6690 family protein [Pirellulaceae bacterium]
MSGMIGKPGWVLLLLAGAFVVPYALCDKDLHATVAKALGRGEPAAATADASPPTDAAAPVPVVAPIPLAPQAPPCDLASALHFDVTPQWVTGTWPRVTTAVADTKFSGLRVPLVTGVMPDDLVGTLTYYFDEEQRVQRITFAGNTADPRRLVSLVTSQYRLLPQPTLDAGLYQSKWNGKVISSLQVRHASVAEAGAARGSYDVRLDLNRADALAGTASAPRRLFGW